MAIEPSIGSESADLTIRFRLPVLEHGSCEPLKAGVHATTLALCVVMGMYNAAAWLARRERHLAVNAIVYAALIAWEREHVMHHLGLRPHPGTKPVSVDRTPAVPAVPAA
jgi:hypothetical protein